MPPRSLLVCLGLGLVVVCLATLAVSAQQDGGKQYRDCETCVENGYGWSWNKNACGGYLNTNCDPDSAEALDEEEDEENFVPPPQQQQQQQPDQDEIEDEEDTTPFQIPDPAPIPTEPVPHANTEQTTLIWNLCHKGDLQQLAAWIFREPGVVHLRSEDGRGALWWANEFAHFDMIDFLIERGADPEATDDAGNSPAELLPASAKRPRNVQKVNTEQAAQMAKQQIQQQRKFMQQQQRQQQQAPN